jgi:hypothetical protein
MRLEVTENAIQQQQRTIHTLPENYHEVYFWGINTRNMILLNVLSLIPLAISAALMFAWTALIIRLRGPWPDEGILVSWAGVAILLIVIPVHELIHGLAILWAGHKPRYGAKLSKLVFYATADNAYFWRNQYLVVALAPLVVITLAGMIGMLAVNSLTMAFYLALAVIVNAASAIGDLYMTVIALRYPKDILVRDEAEGMRVFAPIISE